METVRLESTSWTTTKVGTRFLVETRLTRRDKDGTLEELNICVAVGDAAVLSGAETHTAALVRAREILNEALLPRTQG